MNTRRGARVVSVSWAPSDPAASADVFRALAEVLFGTSGPVFGTPAPLPPRPFSQDSVEATDGEYQPAHSH